MITHVPTWSKTDLSNHPHFTLCLYTKWIKKLRQMERWKACMWTANLVCSPAGAGSEQRPGPQGSLFPHLATPPPHTHMKDSPLWGKAWQRSTVCVCEHDVNFLFYRGSNVCMCRLFRFSLWEKKDNSHESVWENNNHCFWEVHFSQ